MTLSDFLPPFNAFDTNGILPLYDAALGLGLVVMGMAVGAFVLWHLPTARTAGISVQVLAALFIALEPLLFIFVLRLVEDPPPPAAAERTVGTALLLLCHTLGIGIGLTIRKRLAIRAAKRAALPHGHHVRTRHEHQS